MKILKRTLLALAIGFLLLVVGMTVWGRLGQGTLTPANTPAYHPEANRVVMVFGATGSVGDGLLKAAMEAPEVEKVHVVTRRSSPRIDAGVAAGRVRMHVQQDFTDYAGLAAVLGEVSTVLWGLGTSSLNVDDDTYTRIHVDFPVAFVSAWLAARPQGPLAFHYVTGMGTDPEGSAHWAREKGRAEHELAALAENTALRTFSYRSAFIRPTSEQANVLHHLLELLLRPGRLVITATELGQAMLVISSRTGELANGTLIDNADSIAYAKLHGPG
tara:strand:+ start:30325 stop:31143 length:819 start_codon:yes stop_codon:yes gene_type:complete